MKNHPHHDRTARNGAGMVQLAHKALGGPTTMSLRHPFTDGPAVAGTPALTTNASLTRSEKDSDRWKAGCALFDENWRIALQAEHEHNDE